MLDLSKMTKVSRLHTPRGKLYTQVSYNPKTKKLYVPATLMQYLDNCKNVDIYNDEVNKYYVIVPGTEHHLCKRDDLSADICITLPLERGRYGTITAYTCPGQICISYR